MRRAPVLISMIGVLGWMGLSWASCQKVPDGFGPGSSIVCDHGLPGTTRPNPVGRGATTSANNGLVDTAVPQTLGGGATPAANCQRVPDGFGPGSSIVCDHGLAGPTAPQTL